MEDMNWTRIIGLTLLIVGGAYGLVGGLAFLASLFSYEYSIPILIALMLIAGACFWIFEKKGGKK